MWYIPIIAFGIFFVIFLAIAISAFRSHKHTGDTMRNMINTVSAYAEKEIENVFNPPKEETKICEYCGSTIPNGNTKCNSCGAKAKK